MSDADYRSFIGKIVFPKDTTNYPYTRKAGGSTVLTYLLSVAAMNGPDQLIKIEFWDKAPDAVVDKALVYVSGKWNNEPYTNKDGEEVKPRQLNVNYLWPLQGENVMAAFTGAPKTVVKKRTTMTPSLDLDEDF